MDFGDIGGAIQEMRLVLTKPDHPIEAGRDVDRLAGDRVDPLGPEARREPAHLVPRSLREPDDGPTDRFALPPPTPHALPPARNPHPRRANAVLRVAADVRPGRQLARRRGKKRAGIDLSQRQRSQQELWTSAPAIPRRSTGSILDGENRALFS